MADPSLEIAEFKGLDTRSSIVKMDPRFSPDPINVDLYRNTLRCRDSLWWANFESAAKDNITQNFILGNADGSRTALWWEDAAANTNAYSRLGPGLYSGIPTGTQQGAALTHQTYPKRWELGRKPQRTQIHNTAFFCNGRDVPMFYHAVAEFRRWTPYQPRDLAIGVQTPAPYAINSVRQDGFGPVTGLFLASGNLRYAITYVNKLHPDEPESNPIWINHADARTPTISGLPHIPWATNAGIKRITFYLMVPLDPQVTHIRLYRSRTGGQTLKYMAEVDVATSPLGWTAYADDPDDLARYGDAALLNARDLEYDHDPPPCLGRLYQLREYLFGSIDWDPNFLPGRRSLNPDHAAATITAMVAPAAGYVVTISQAAGGPTYRVDERLVGMTIRFPLGSNRPYTIFDAINRFGHATDQRLLIGHPIGHPDVIMERVDPADYALAGAVTDFIIEAPMNRLYWTTRGQPWYWKATNYREIGEDDGQDISGLGEANNSLLIGKPDRLYSLYFESTPHVGYGSSLRLVSSFAGAPNSESILTIDNQRALIRNRLGYFLTDGFQAKEILGDRLSNTTVSGTCTASALHPEKDLAFFFQGTTAHVIRTTDFAFVPWNWPASINAACRGPDANGVDRLWLGDDYGDHHCLVDVITGQGDGHAAEVTVGTAEFFAQSRCTGASTAQGELIDAGNVFPDNAAGTGKIVNQAVRIIAGTGAGLSGRVTVRTSATVLQTTIVGWLDGSSVYEIGYIDWQWPMPFLRVPQGAYVAKPQVWYEPKAYGSGNIRGLRHRKRFYVAAVQGMTVNSAGAFAVMPFIRTVLERFDEAQGEALVESDWENNRFLVNYTNSTYATTSPHVSPAREIPNPGVAHIEFMPHATLVRFVVGEQGVKVGAEITFLDFRVISGEGREAS